MVAPFVINTMVVITASSRLQVHAASRRHPWMTPAPADRAAARPTAEYLRRRDR
jgi:hypothetical protein